MKFTACKLSAVVHDYPVWNAKSDHDVLEELFGLPGCDLGYRFGFNPLGELVDGDEEMCKTTRRRLEGSDHVESPCIEGPGDRGRLKLLRRHVYLPSEVLTSLTCVDDGVRVGNCGWPEETLPIDFAYQSS